MRKHAARSCEIVTELLDTRTRSVVSDTRRAPPAADVAAAAGAAGRLVQRRAPRLPKTPSNPRRVCDFVLSNELISKTLAMVAVKRDMNGGGNPTLPNERCLLSRPSSAPYRPGDARAQCWGSCSPAAVTSSTSGGLFVVVVADLGQGHTNDVKILSELGRGDGA